MAWTSRSSGPKSRDAPCENRYDALRIETHRDRKGRSAATDRVTIMQPPPRKSIRHPTRRATVGLGLSAAIFSLSPIARVSAQTPTPGELHARFLRWSRSATGFADLPADAARTCMELLFRSGITPESLSALEPDSYRGTPFEKRLLEAWYTGLFKLDGLSEVRSFDTTLMWRAAGIDPPPSICGGGPESWASAPSNI